MRFTSLLQLFYAVFKREVYRISSSWVLLFSNLIAPMGAFLIIYWIFSHGVIRDLPVCIVDQDNTSTSQKIKMLIDASSSAEVEFKVADVGLAQSYLEEGKAAALIIIPEGLEKGILKNTNKALTVYINNMNLVKGGVLYSGLYRTLATIEGGIKLQIFTKQGLTEQTAMAQIQPIRVDTHILFNPFGNYAYFLVTGLLPVMCIVFMFLGTLYAFGSELRFGSAENLLNDAKQNIWIAIAGKMLPYTLIYMTQMLLMDIILINVLGIPIKGSLFLILLSELVLVISYQCLAFFLLNLTGNLRFSLSLGSAYTMMALTFSGLTFPSMAMPLIAKLFSYIFPYTFWLKIFLSQSLRGEPVHTIYILFIVLMAFSLLGIVSLPGLKRKYADPNQYGRR